MLLQLLHFLLTMAFDLRVPPEEFSALPAGSSTETGFASALASNLQHTEQK